MGLSKVIGQAEKLVIRLQEVKAQMSRIEARQRELEAAGMVDAKPYWHQKVYLYLYSRMESGTRPREYIGRDQAKIRAALEKVERFEEHKKLAKSLSDLENTVETIAYSLNTADSALKVAEREREKAEQ